jgi:hypothetical protein
LKSDLRVDDTRVRSRFQHIRSYLNGKEEALAEREGLSVGWQLLVFFVVLIALFSRCPSLLTRAQFYAEDGMFWFAQAYNGGWLHSLTVPNVGYLSILERLGAGLSLLVPLRWAPLVMAILGLLIQALPVTILLSARCRNWAPLPTRMVLAALYVALPNAKEIHVVLTNAMWHLALAAVLLAFGSSPRTWVGRFSDCVLFLVAALSGPFCILLAPMVLVFWWIRRQRWSLFVASLMSIGALTQIFFLLHTPERTHAVLGVGLASLLRMLGGNIVACAMFGGYPLGRMAPISLIVPAAIGGLAICLSCLRFAKLEWKLFLVYCAALLAASLRSPLIPPIKPLWEMLVYQNSSRYWFFPTLAFVWSAVWCALYARTRLVKIVGACVFLSMSIGIVDSWVYRGYPDEHYASSVRLVRDAKPGEHVIIPIVPDGFHMELVKKRP